MTGTEHFSEGRLNSANHQWGFHAATRFILAEEIVGRVVNIGTKDGLVLDSVTVHEFDPGTGIMIFRGGTKGWPHEDREPVPNEVARIYLPDVARGYLHSESD